MSYSMISPGLSPDQFGSGMGDGLGGFLGRWGDATQRGLYSGMNLGSQLTSYGTNQRLAGLRETNQRQALQTQLVTSQNNQLNQMSTQALAACRAIGGASPYCQMLEAEAAGRVPAGSAAAVQSGGGAQGPLSGGSNASAALGVADDYDAYDYQQAPQGQIGDWY